MNENAIHVVIIKDIFCSHHGWSNRKKAYKLSFFTKITNIFNLSIK